MHEKVLRMALHAISIVRDEQIIFIIFYVQVEYSKSNINDRYRVSRFPGIRMFAILPPFAKLSYILE